MVRAYKYGFSSTLHTVENMADVADKALFEKILVERHCLHGLLPTKRAYGFLRPRGTLWSCPAVNFNCTKDPYYHDAGMNIFDRVLNQVSKLGGI